MSPVSVIFRVYCADHTFCTLRLPVNATAETIKVGAYEKCSLRHPVQDLRIVEVKSNGERVPFRDSEHSIPTTVALNSCIFLTPKDHMDALVMICVLHFRRCVQMLDAVWVKTFEKNVHFPRGNKNYIFWNDVKIFIFFFVKIERFYYH